MTTSETVRALRPDDRDAWLAMRDELWPGAREERVRAVLFRRDL